MPYTTSLGGWLTYLELNEVRRLHTFEIDGGTTKLGSQRFPVLRQVNFTYNAHCCQLKRNNYSWYSPSVNPGLTSSSVFRRMAKFISNYFLSEQIHLDQRSRRQASPPGGDLPTSLACINYAELNILLSPYNCETPTDPPTTEPPTTTQMPDVCDCQLYPIPQFCDFCFGGGCESLGHIDCTPYQVVCDSCSKRRRKRDVPENAGVAGAQVTNDTVLPDGWFYLTNSTELICTEFRSDVDASVSIITQVLRPYNDTDMDGTDVLPSTASSLSPSPTSPAIAEMAPSTSAQPVDVSVTPSSTTIAMTILESSTIVPMAIVPTTTISEPSVSITIETSEVAIPIVVTTSISGPSVASTSTQTPCPASIVDVSCVLTLQPMTTPTTPPNGWFFPNPNNKSFVCVPLDEIENTPPLPTTPPTTETTTTGGQVEPHCDPEFFSFDSQQLVKTLTVCYPQEDPFNPCEDLLGEDNVLRSFIWIVICLALIFNSLVISVFIGYTLIIKRTKIELFVVHFFYFHLALADFIMGIYLLTIAIQDLRTLNNFAEYDVVWRTEGGCKFAGFCAITSTMTSVFILVIITMERLYTFSRALRKSHTNKKTAYFLIVLAWIFGSLMGALPLMGVSSYTSTAICLPFDVSSSNLALPYVLFLLLFTGIAFTVIAISYAVIFYQVFYRRRATLSSVSDKKRLQTELKVALRMGVLVLTNFVCWFPIALLGISAAVGNSLVNNIVFAKWVMVFIFPINACLNPILYSVLSKVFRDNLVLLLGKCGLCQSRAFDIKRQRAGLTPSMTSNPSKFASTAGLISEERRSTIIERFRNFSITSSSGLLMGRRSSMMSQTSSEERYRIELTGVQGRRCSEYSSASSEDILGIRVSSRRESAFSAGSIEEATTYGNPGFRSNSPMGSEPSVVDVASQKCAPPRTRISLGAVPEEDFENSVSEVSVAPEPSSEDRHNPAYVDADDDTETEIDDLEIDKEKYSSVNVECDIQHYTVIDSSSEKDSGHGEEEELQEVSVQTNDYSEDIETTDMSLATTEQNSREDKMSDTEFD